MTQRAYTTRRASIVQALVTKLKEIGRRTQGQIFVSYVKMLCTVGRLRNGTR